MVFILILVGLLGASMVAYGRHRARIAPPEGDWREIVFGLAGVIVLGVDIGGWVMLAAFYLMAKI